MINQKYQVLLVDISNIFYRAITALDYCTENGTDISGLYGTLNTLQSQIKAHNPTVVVGVFDGKGGTDRKRKIIEGYKEGRRIPVKLNYFVNKVSVTREQILEQQKQFQENFIWQMRKLNEFLSFLPIHRVVVEGYEADEVIAYLCQSYFKKSSVLIVSEDKDYHQLVSDRVNIWNFHDLVNKEYLKKRWGSEHGNIVNFIRTLDGDRSDKINGVYGYGVKTIEKYFGSLLERDDIETVDDLKKYLGELIVEIKDKKTDYAKNWKTVLGKAEHLLIGKDKTTGLSSIDIIDRNYQVMQLRNPEISTTGKLKIVDFMKLEVKFNPSAYKMAILQEGIQMQGSNIMSWEMQFKNLQYNQIMFSREQENKDVA